MIGGNLLPSCVAVEGGSCRYACNDGFSRNSAVDDIVCLSSGEWNVKTDKLCLGIHNYFISVPIHLLQTLKMKDLPLSKLTVPHLSINHLTELSISWHMSFRNRSGNNTALSNITHFGRVDFQVQRSRSQFIDY